MRDELGDLYQQLDAYYAQGDRGGAELFLRDIRRRAEEALPQDGAARARRVAACNELGALYRKTGQYDASLDAFRQTLEDTALCVGRDCAEYATILNNMAGTCRLAGDFAQAVELFCAAMEIYQAQGQTESYAYASVLNNLALAYREMDRRAEATATLEQALALLERYPGNEREIAVTYSNLTSLYHSAGDTRRAMACLDKALALFAACGNQRDPNYAAALNSLAGVLYAAGDDARALETYQASARYTKAFFGENADYGVTHQNMRWVYERLGQREKALEALAVAERTYTALFGPGHSRVCAVREDQTRLRRRTGA